MAHALRSQAWWRQTHKPIIITIMIKTGTETNTKCDEYPVKEKSHSVLEAGGCDL